MEKNVFGRCAQNLTRNENEPIKLVAKKNVWNNNNNNNNKVNTNQNKLQSTNQDDHRLNNLVMK